MTEHDEPRHADGLPMSETFDAGNIANKDPVIEIASLGLLITDIVHHRPDRHDRLRHSLLAASKARHASLTKSEAGDLGVHLVALFSDPEIRDTVAQLRDQQRQFALIPSDAKGAPQFYWDRATADHEEHHDASLLDLHIKRLGLSGMASSLGKLGLEFKIVPLRPSLASDLATPDRSAPQP